MSNNSVSHTSSQGGASSRRQFMKATSASVIAGAVASQIGRSAFAGGGDLLKVGLVGCGGRGSGAAVQALSADSNVKLHAMCDVFPDRLERSLENLMRTEVKAKIDVPKERQFSGFDGYKQAISAVDVVLLATPPHFRPMHVEEAVRQNKHVFVEKPVATDPVGVQRMIKACKEAKAKGLAVLSGLCYRYENKKRELIKRIHDGQIGQIVGAQCAYNTSGLWHRGNDEKWSEMEYQMRNWLYFDWLSGDHIIEQHIHSYDKIVWAMGDKYPTAALGTGGRIVRTEPEYGNIYDHFHVVYEFDNDVFAHSSCRQMNNCSNDVSDWVFGTKGVANIQASRPYIKGENPWRYRPKRDEVDNMYQNEHDEFFASIRAGKPIDNSDYMCKSTLMGIMGRMSAYTGKRLTWDDVLDSRLDLSPKSYEWGPLPVRPVPKPGLTKLV